MASPRPSPPSNAPSSPDQGRFDRYLAGDKNAMGSEAVRGAELFNGKGGCAACHSGPLFSDQSFHNLGVWRKGRTSAGSETVTKSPADRGKFKTRDCACHALRNPYMHDGKTKTLADVVHYLDRWRHCKPEPRRAVKPLNLTVRERRDLVAFLKALTVPSPGSATESPVGRRFHSASRKASHFGILAPARFANRHPQPPACSQDVGAWRPGPDRAGKESQPSPGPTS